MIKSLIFLMFLASCASSKYQGRNPSSVGDKCFMEKHSKKEHYRVVINNEAYNNFWYKEKDAQAILDRVNKQGRCK